MTAVSSKISSGVKVKYRNPWPCIHAPDMDSCNWVKPCWHGTTVSRSLMATIHLARPVDGWGGQKRGLRMLPWDLLCNIVNTGYFLLHKLQKFLRGRKAVAAERPIFRSEFCSVYGEFGERANRYHACSLFSFKGPRHLLRLWHHTVPHGKRVTADNSKTYFSRRFFSLARRCLFALNLPIKPIMCTQVCCDCGIGFLYLLKCIPWELNCYFHLIILYWASLSIEGSKI